MTSSANSVYNKLDARDVGSLLFCLFAPGQSHSMIIVYFTLSKASKCLFIPLVSHINMFCKGKVRYVINQE